MCLDLQPIVSVGTILAPSPARLILEVHKHLNRPVVITGGSGGGKTKLLEGMERLFIDQGIGFTKVDPHGDGCDQVKRYCAAAGIDPGRVDEIKPSPKRAPRIDAFEHVPPGLTDREYADWLSTTTDIYVGAFLRGYSLADQEVMARMQNQLRTILYACGVKVDGRHLGVGNALLLTNPARRGCREAMERIGPRLLKLDDDAYYQLEELHSTSDYNRNKMIESTVNCLRKIFRSGTVRSMFLPSEAEAWDPRRAILESRVQLVNLRKSEFVSRQAANVVGGVIISMMQRAAERLAAELDEAERVLHILDIDEAENFVGEDLRMGFAELRKFKMPQVLAFQDVNCLLKGDMDLVSKAFGNAGLVMSFCQQDVESIEYLGKVYAYGSFDFTKKKRKQVLPNGYDWEPTESVSVNVGTSRGRSLGVTATQTHSQTRQEHTGWSIQESVSLALAESHTEGGSITLSEGENETQTESDSSTNGTALAEQEARARSEGVTKSAGVSERPGAPETASKNTALAQVDNVSRGLTKTANESRTNGTAVAKGKQSGVAVARQASDTDGLTLTRGGSLGLSGGRSAGESDGRSLGVQYGVTEGENFGVSVTRQLTPLARHVIEEFEDGLEEEPDVQIARRMNQLAGMPDRLVLVKCKGFAVPFVIQTNEVRDPYEEIHGVPFCAEWQADDLRRFEEGMRAAHAHYFVPNDVDFEAVVSAFLGTRGPEANEPGGPQGGPDDEPDDDPYGV